MGKIVIDPVTRIEGHLKIECVVENGVVKDARATGNLFRGLELILRGRDPRDAQIIAQRICGVCPQSHGIAATLNLDSAFGIADKIPDNGRIIRNLIHGAHVVQDHVLHFYHLAALDYVNVADVAKYEGNDSQLNSVKDFIQRGALEPFLPRYEGDYRLPPAVNQQAVAHYVKALEIRRIGHEAVSIFSGKIPHSVGVVPGGVTTVPTADNIMAYIWKIKILQDFVNNVYIPDVLAVAGAYIDYAEIGVGCKNLLSYGMYDLDGKSPDYATRERLFKQGTIGADLKPGALDTAKITEQVKHSWYEDSTSNRHPSQGDTKPQYGKKDAYSWAKAPRYDGKVYEVGPLARVAVTYAKGDPKMKELVEGSLKQLKAIAGGALLRARPPPGAGALRQVYRRSAGRLGAAVETRRSPPTSNIKSPKKRRAWASSKARAAPWDTGLKLKTRKSPTTRRSCPPPGTSPRWMIKASTGLSSRRLSARRSRTRKTPLKSCASSALSTPASPAPSISLPLKVETSVSSG